MADFSQPLAPAVTIDRVAQVMRDNGVEVWRDSDNDGFARAVLNELNVLFALLDSVLIIRAEAMTGVPAENADPTLHLACNMYNCENVGRRAVVFTAEDKLVVRTEEEIPVFAGATDNQLAVWVKSAVDHVIGAHPQIIGHAETLLGTDSE